MVMNQCFLSTDVAPNWVYNADQTGLYFTKLPNRLYVKKAERKNFAAKQMNAKELDTLIVCAAADGTKRPLAMNGKSKTPTCFKKEVPNGELHPILQEDT